MARRPAFLPCGASSLSARLLLLPCTGRMTGARFLGFSRGRCPPVPCGGPVSAECLLLAVPADFSASRPAGSAAPGAVAGMQGAKPLAKENLKFPPFPGVGRALFERGSGGWGQKVYTRSGKAGRRRGQNPAEKSRNPLDFCRAAWYHMNKDFRNIRTAHRAEIPKETHGQKTDVSR